MHPPDFHRYIWTDEKTFNTLNQEKTATKLEFFWGVQAQNSTAIVTA
jgi:hypothetical protein